MRHAARARASTWELSQLGAWFSSLFLQGDIAEIMVHDRAFTDLEREGVASYLAFKYDVP